MPCVARRFWIPRTTNRRLCELLPSHHKDRALGGLAAGWKTWQAVIQTDEDRDARGLSYFCDMLVNELALFWIGKLFIVYFLFSMFFTELPCLHVHTLLLLMMMGEGLFSSTDVMVLCLLASEWQYSDKYSSTATLNNILPVIILSILASQCPARTQTSHERIYICIKIVLFFSLIKKLIWWP